MIWIILATGLGANFIVIALLFRRLRHNLDRQLSDMRAERNSEWILRALELEGPPEERERPAQAAGGGSHTLPLHPRPVRRKKHLGLYNGGGAIVAALLTLSAVIRYARQSNQAHLVSTVLGTTALAATTITVLQVTPWQQPIDTVPPIPTPAVTMQQTPGPTAPAQDSRPPAPTADTQPSRSPAPAADGAAPSTAAPSNPPDAGGTPKPRPSDATSPAVTPSATLTRTTATPVTCVHVLVVGACLAGSG